MAVKSLPWLTKNHSKNHFWSNNVHIGKIFILITVIVLQGCADMLRQHHRDNVLFLEGINSSYSSHYFTDDRIRFLSTLSNWVYNLCWDHDIELGRLAQHPYTETGKYFRNRLRRMGYDIHYFSGHATKETFSADLGDNPHTAGVILTKAGEIIIAFHGTEVRAGLRDLYTSSGQGKGDADKHFGLDGQVSLAYQNAFLSSADEIKSIIQPYFSPNTQIYVTGHSLGGAFAHLCGAWLYDQYHRKRQSDTFVKSFLNDPLYKIRRKDNNIFILTLAAPAAFDLVAIKAINQEFSRKNILTFIHHDDPIPINYTGYTFPGRIILFEEEAETHFLAHSSGNYIEEIERWLKTGRP